MRPSNNNFLKNMKNYQEVIGIDVSKNKLDAYAYNRSSHREFSNDIVGYKALLKWANGKEQKVFFCFENTGHYSLKLALYLSSKKRVYVQENPAVIINRRVSRRVTTLRSLSAEIIDEPADDATATLVYAREIDAVFRLNMGIFKIKYSMNFLMNLMYHFGVASVLALGGYYVIEGVTEIGTIVAFISGLSQINAPWGDVVDWYREWRVTQTKYGMITKVLAVLNTAGPTPAVAGAAAAEAG